MHTQTHTDNKQAVLSCIAATESTLLPQPLPLPLLLSNRANHPNKQQLQQRTKNSTQPSLQGHMLNASVGPTCLAVLGLPASHTSRSISSEHCIECKQLQQQPSLAAHALAYCRCCQLCSQCLTVPCPIHRDIPQASNHTSSMASCLHVVPQHDQSCKAVWSSKSSINDAFAVHRRAAT